MRLIKTSMIAVLTLAAWDGLAPAQGAPPAAPATGRAFELRSPAFANGGKLPAEFTCDGSSISPPLEWRNPPAGTRSFALTMHHIPGPGDRHVSWVVYDIPAGTNRLAKGDSQVGTRGINTVNRRAVYAPPCSRGPGEKSYTLTLHALSSAPQIRVSPSSLTMDLLRDAITDRTLASAVLDATYDRPSRADAPPDDPDDRGRPGPPPGDGPPPPPPGDGPPPPPPSPLASALDTDGDGEISADEIRKASAALLTLDKNKDGKLTADELRPPRPPRPPGPPPEGPPPRRRPEPPGDGRRPPSPPRGP